MNSTPKHILCAIDFSRFCVQAVFFAGELAKKFGAGLTLFHAAYSLHDPFYETELRRDARKNHLHKIEEKIEALMQPYVNDWDTEITSGELINELNRAVLNKKADIVIAASHGLSGLKRMLVGAVVERIAYAMPVPFLAVHLPKYSDQTSLTPPLTVRRIVAGCDLMPDARPLVEYSLSLAQAFHADLDLLHAVDTPLYEKKKEDTGASYEQVEKEILERKRQQLMKIVPGESHHFVNPVAIPEVPGDAMCAYANQVKADIIAVGVRKKESIDKRFRGVTTKDVLRHTPCSVLTIPI